MKEKMVTFVKEIANTFIKNESIIVYQNKLRDNYTEYYSSSIIWPDGNRIISKNEYKEFRDKANSLGYRISGFKKFDGDINLVLDCLEKTQIIREKYPELFKGRKQIILKCSKPGFPLDNDTFAMIGSNNHEILINQYAFRSRKKLELEYQKLVDQGYFVKGTDYYSILIHELGHIVGRKYHIDNLKISEKISGLNSSDILAFLRHNLSLYSGHFDDGREIISEVFSDYFNCNNTIEFSLKFIKEIDKIILKKE